MNNGIFENWQDDCAERFGRQTLHLRHRLAESGLFTHEALAALIEKVPESHYNLNTMGYDATNPEMREGVLGAIAGSDVISAIENGRMWLNMRRVQEIDSRYEKLLSGIYRDFASKVPGLATFREALGILISSPDIQVYYHADVPGQSLWQLHGRKRVYIYPNTEPYLSQQSLEGIIMGDTEEEIPYMPRFDEDAEVYDLGPGEMLNWALNGPHRVVNEDCLNISVTTEHWTSDIRRSYAVNYANGVLRKRFGLSNLSRDIHGPTVYPKAALAMAWRKLKLNRKDEFVRMVRFTIDPQGENGMRPIEERPKFGA